MRLTIIVDNKLHKLHDLFDNQRYFVINRCAKHFHQYTPNHLSATKNQNHDVKSLPGILRNIIDRFASLRQDVES